MITQVVGLGAAARYLAEIGMENVADHEHRLVAATLAGLAEIPQVRIIRPQRPGSAPPPGLLRRRRCARPRRRAGARTDDGVGRSATIAPRPCTVGMVWRPPSVPRLRCTTQSTKWTGWTFTCAGPSTSLETTAAPGADVPGSDPGPLQAPAPPRTA